MSGARRLIQHFSAQEQSLLRAHFFAPCVHGGKARTRVAGLVYVFDVLPDDFEGWGVFRPVDARHAQLIEPAPLPTVARYLGLFQPLRVHLIKQLRGATWLAYPANESDMHQRFGTASPVPVHLASAGAQFEQIITRHDGATWWFDEADRRADPALADALRVALGQMRPLAELHIKGLTPEQRNTYAIALQPLLDAHQEAQQKTDEVRLRRALEMAGGTLAQFADRGEYWWVAWTSRDGQQHTSAIAKRDLTVVSAGICLSDRDSDFDLQSLVGVVAGRD